MKKKVISIALVIALIAVIAVGSFAYFTDTKSATNTFTQGNVKIDLQEGTKMEGQETQANLTDWATTYPNGAVLMPGTSKDGNAVSKIITVKNTGNNDAWVWVELKIPRALIADDFAIVGQLSGSGDAKNSLHINEYGAFMTRYYDSYNTMKETSSPVTDGILNIQGAPLDANMVAYTKDNCWDGFNVVAVDDEYVTLRSAMTSPLSAGKVSLPCLRQAYMDWRVMQNDDGSFTLVEGANYTGEWKIDVTAYAIQANGIANVNAAIAAYANNGK